MATSVQYDHDKDPPGGARPPAPIGVFWDIENCCVPRGKSALSLVQRVRQTFFCGHREVEFMCVCDTSKEPRDVIQELNYAQVTVVHIHATSKNAADDKLRQSLRRYANAYQPPATAVLLSGDVNFASELSDLRYRHHHRVILVHPRHTQTALRHCAHECHLYDDLTADLPDRGSKLLDTGVELVISNLPRSRPVKSVVARLRQLSDNCGGRVGSATRTHALIRFPNDDAASRAKKRLNGEDVYGAKIIANFCSEEFSSIESGSPKPRNRDLEAVGGRSLSLSPQPRFRTRSWSRSKTPTTGNHDNIVATNQEPQRPSHVERVPFRQSRSCDNSSRSENGVQFQQPVISMNSGIQSYAVDASTNTDQADNTKYEPRVLLSKNKKQKKNTGEIPVTNTNVALNQEVVTPNYLENLDMKPERDVNTVKVANPPAGTNSSPTKSPKRRRRRRKSQSDKKESKTKNKTQPKEEEIFKTLKLPSEDETPQNESPQSPDVIIEPESDEEAAKPKVENLPKDNVVSDKSKIRGMCFVASQRSKHWHKYKYFMCAASPHKMYKPRPMRPKYHSPAKFNNGGYGNQYNYQMATPPGVRKFNHYQYTSWREGGYYSHFGYAQEGGGGGGDHQPPPQPPPQEKLGRHQKSSREYMFLQQQIYEDDAEVPDDDLMLSEDTDVFCRDECHSAPPLPFHHSYNSPPARHRVHSIPSPSVHRFSNFRRTPGASRPASRQGHYSGDSGRRPDSALSVRSNQSYDDSGGGGGAHFQPIRNSSPMLNASDLGEDGRSDGGDADYVELMVSNLDYNISAREWRKILYAEFHQHVQVQGVYIQTQPDNTNIGFIKVPSVDDARFAISQFHRKKIGYKRIHVTLVNQDDAASANTRTDVVTLLQEVPSHQLSLYKLMELFEKRFQRPVTVSELYSFTDSLEILELEGQGRIVRLLASLTDQQGGECTDESLTDAPESALCPTHCPAGNSSFQDAMETALVLFVTLQLKSFSAQVHTLIQSHEDCLPLASFATCYSSEFGTLPTVSQGGVPVEHLISCVPGVKIAVTPSGAKNVQWAENKPPSISDQSRPCSSPLLSQQLLQFSREVVELLKYAPQCRLAFNKFIPTYHHTLGRQCRVADYGYTKLLELFDAIPHIVQVIGVGNRKYVTLTHRAQMKRFAMDMTRVLKSQASKQISVLDLPVVFNKVMGKPFDITEYGLCYLEDVLSELPDHTIATSGVSDEMILSIPKRDQTGEEVEMTKQFALEVIDLLKHTPQSRMPFHRFIPAYHHHFGKQCRVSDYGFTKLVELFEAIPHVLKIVDEQEDKVLTLVEPELLAVLEDQVIGLLKACPQHKLPVPEFLSSYTKQHGHSLRLQDYGVTSVVQLMEKIQRVAKVESLDGKYIIRLVDRTHVQMLAQRVLLLLMDLVDGTMGLDTLQARYRELFGYSFTEDEVNNDLDGLVQLVVSGGKKCVRLCPLQMFARDIRSLLRHHHGKLALVSFDAAYASHFGVHLVPASYGYQSTTALLQAIPHVAQIRGKAHNRTVLLCQDFTGKLTTGPPSRVERATSPLVPDPEITDSGISTSFNSHSTNGKSPDLMGHTPTLRSSPNDLLAARVPSGIPSPNLTPSSPTPTDLLRFDQVPFNVQDFFSTLSPDEKHGQKTPLCKTPVSDILQFAAQLLPSDSNSSGSSNTNTSLVSPLGGPVHPYTHQDVPPVPSGAHHVAVLEQQQTGYNQQTMFNSPGMGDGLMPCTFSFGRPTVFTDNTSTPGAYFSGASFQDGLSKHHNTSDDRKLLSILQGHKNDGDTPKTSSPQNAEQNGVTLFWMKTESVNQNRSPESSVLLSPTSLTSPKLLAPASLNLPSLVTPSNLQLVTPASLTQPEVPPHELMTPAALSMPSGKLPYSTVVAQGSPIQQPSQPGSPKKMTVADRLISSSNPGSSTSSPTHKPETWEEGRRGSRLSLADDDTGSEASSQSPNHRVVPGSNSTPRKSRLAAKFTASPIQ